MIKVNNISYTIDGKNILSNININIIRNKITVITGKNGSGKSSLIKIINKIIIPNKGTINSESVSYTHLPSPRDSSESRMPASA